eukprot:2530526-Pleurochrysis_carterae.AAC.1
MDEGEGQSKDESARKAAATQRCHGPQGGGNSGSVHARYAPSPEAISPRHLPTRPALQLTPS